MITMADTFGRGETVVGEACGNDFLVLDLDSGAYYGLGEVGGFIWQSLDGELDLVGIADRVASRYGIDATRAETDLIEFVAQLLDRGLIDLASSR